MRFLVVAITTIFLAVSCNVEVSPSVGSADEGVYLDRQAADSLMTEAVSNVPITNVPITNVPTTVDQIIDRYVQALGGIEAAKRISTLEANGTFELVEARLNGSVVMYAKVPNKVAISFRTTDDSIFTITAYDGIAARERSLRQEEERIDFREITGAELQKMRLNSDFYREYKLKELYPRMTLKGKQQVDGFDTYVIEAMPKVGRSEKMYFDVHTGLLRRRDTIENGAAAESYFDDYRPIIGVNGVKHPYTLTVVHPTFRERDLIIRLNEVKANVYLIDSTFTLHRD